MLERFRPTGPLSKKKFSSHGICFAPIPTYRNVLKIFGRPARACRTISFRKEKTSRPTGTWPKKPLGPSPTRAFGGEAAGGARARAANEIKYTRLTRGAEIPEPQSFSRDVEMIGSPSSAFTGQWPNNGLNIYAQASSSGVGREVWFIGKGWALLGVPQCSGFSFAGFKTKRN